MALAEILEALNEFGFFTVSLIFCLVVLGIIFAVKTIKEASGLFGKSHRQLLDEEVEARLTTLEARASGLEASAKKFGDDRVHDREQSFEKQHYYDDMILAVSAKQDAIIERVDALAEQNRKYQLADIRETLLQAYRYYTSESTNPMRSWSEMESHAWEEQYRVYEQNGGNSYMQHTVKPEMDKLRVISLDDYKLMAELMASRTKKN